MGTFLSVSSVVGKSKTEVVSSLANYAASVNGGLQQEEGLDSETPNACIIEEENGNTSIFYPEEFLEWDDCSRFLSRELAAPVFSFHIHDGDFWMYILFHKGEIADQFNPVPDYWDENISAQESRKWSGNANEVARFVPGITAGSISRYLVGWKEDDEPAKAYPSDEFEREDWQLTDFMKKIGVPYPIDDDGEPKGETYRLWTEQMKLERADIGDRNRKTRSGKPWWKFW